MPPTAAGMIELLEAGGRRALSRPLDYVSLTKAQRTFDEIEAPAAAWVDGNAVGKSFELAYMVHRFCRDEHPAMRRATRRPARVLVIGESYDQMVPLMEKLWELAHRGDLSDTCGFEPGRGITGKPPRIVYVDGPGRGAEIWFSTYRAGAKRIAGGQFDLIVCDEPPPGSLLGEILPRLFRRRGFLRIGFTPVPDMRDQTELRTRFDSTPAAIIRHTVGMREENMWPEGFPRPWFWQHEIDEYAAGLLEHERDMRINGSLDPVVTSRWIRDFNEGVHVQAVSLRDVASWALVVGMDHGTADGKQTGMLVAVRDGDTARPEVAYLDEYVAEGFTTPEHDAAAALEMLRRNGLTYDAVDLWVGDVPTGSKRYAVQKSNTEIRKELARQLGRRLEGTRQIEIPKKHASSLTDGSRLVNTLFARRREDGKPCARVRPRCAKFAAALKQFNGNKRHPLKDVFDAGRYATEAGISGEVQRAVIGTARY